MTMDDDVSIDELREAVEHMHGVPARFVEAVEVDERHEGKPVWQPEGRQMRFVRKSGRDGSVAADATRRGITRLRNQIAV
jgi:hypothetical protein